MGVSRLLAALAVAALVLGLLGCAETFSGGFLSSSLFSGNLAESRDTQGRTQRLSVEGIESWQHWHKNTHKGDGANAIVKAQATF